MLLKLKNIKRTEWASQETHCYQASLYVDGKPVAIVSNDGHGGCDRDYPHPKFKGDYRATMNAVNDYFKALPKTDTCDLFPDGIEQQLEYWCCDQVNDWLSSKELKRKLKSHVLIQKLDKDGIYQTKFHPTVTDGNWIRDPRSSLYGSRILNDMSFSDALTIWMGNT